MAGLAPVPLGCLYRQRTGMLLSLVSSRLLRTICSTSFYRAMAAAVGPAPLRAMAMVTLPQDGAGGASALPMRRTRLLPQWLPPMRVLVVVLVVLVLVVPVAMALMTWMATPSHTSGSFWAAAMAAVATAAAVAIAAVVALRAALARAPAAALAPAPAEALSAQRALPATRI